MGQLSVTLEGAAVRPDTLGRTISRIVVVDGDAFPPRGIALLLAPGDTVLVATNNDGLYQQWQTCLAGRDIQGHVYHVPVAAQAADMTLGFLVGKLIGKQPALCHLPWVFVARDKGFLTLQNMLHLEGVPDWNMVQLDITQVKPNGQRTKACETHSPPSPMTKTTASTKDCPAVKQKPKPKPEKKASVAPALSPAVKALFLYAQARQPNKAPMLHPVTLAKWICREVCVGQNQKVQTLAREAGITTFSRQHIVHWTHQHPFRRKGQHIGI